MATAIAFGLAACGGSSSNDNNSDTSKLSVLSSTSPEWVSGGDVAVALPADLPAGSTVKVALNGTDISPAFAADPASGRKVALVSGLINGKNTLTTTIVDASGGTRTGGSLEVTNYPKAGPMFSGPREMPFVCQTASFTLVDGTTLGAPLDADCAVATRVDFAYRTTATGSTQFKPLANPSAPLPSDLASTTTSEGKTVPYIVRIETGTTNRAIYQTSMLFNPASDAPPSLVAHPAGWNGRLVYTFGGGCTGGWYRQGTSTGGVLDDNILKQGYAMASSSLNVFGNNCQDLTAAETMAMVKERFIETYGVPRYTIGWGCSGGSYQQHQIADNYPGLLDGILPGCSFPEVGFATVYSITDLRLLGHYFRDVAPGTFSDAQIEAAAGILSVKTMYTGTVYDGALRIAPDVFCPSALPEAQRYNATTNPTGARCDIYDHTVNVYGKDPVTGFARRPIDNVGVQYGLEALNAGAITVDQFLNVNAAVGGYDVDGKFIATRTVTDTEATKQAYQTGRLTNGGGGLKDVPIIDYRAYADDNPIGDIHLRYHSFSMRERLKKANGDADNQVMLVENFRYGYYSSESPLLLDALKQMDLWLAAIKADTGNGTAHQKVVRNKPATLQEGCNTRDATPTKIVEKLERTSGQCAAIYPAPASPRVAAGANIAADIIKCSLKPVAPSDYKVAFSATQTTRLQTIFAAGVCDWAKPGVEQQGLRGTWLKF
ncbi:MAG: DUF6351 family protein [Burkholderiaceae bacterium]